MNCVRIQDGEQSIPRQRIVFAVTADQRLVLAKINSEPAPHSLESTLPGTALYEQRGELCPPAGAQSNFSSERQCVFAAKIAVTDISHPVVGEIVLQIDLIEEPRLDVET